ncbi:hypothetical protein A0J61_00368 [Choanephora cucurbitarum]|uniref:Uncharacterized protein n=1 Tax=Choanephora cucurbitarum TaxID=101091 RepID=A0A1C7NSG8_9FUNG|nr:hypothetical protein A0J61_00368 [Choanephora cucurbitarum]
MFSNTCFFQDYSDYRHKSFPRKHLLGNKKRQFTKGVRSNPYATPKKMNSDILSRTVLASLKANQGTTVDCYEKPTLYWCAQSVLDYIDIFHDDRSTQISREPHLLNEVYGFIKKSRTISKLTTANGSGSTSSSEAKNKKRKIDGKESFLGQKNGDYFDLVFKPSSVELGCLEKLKTSKMMKAFAMQVIDQFPAVGLNKVKIPLTGMHIEFLKLKHVSSVALLSSSGSYKMSESTLEIPSLLPLVLAVVYSCVQSMKYTNSHLDETSSAFLFIISVGDDLAARIKNLVGNNANWVKRSNRSYPNNIQFVGQSLANPLELESECTAKFMERIITDRFLYVHQWQHVDHKPSNVQKMIKARLLQEVSDRIKEMLTDYINP